MIGSFWTWLKAHQVFIGIPIFLLAGWFFLVPAVQNAKVKEAQRQAQIAIVSAQVHEGLARAAIEDAFFASEHRQKTEEELSALTVADAKLKTELARLKALVSAPPGHSSGGHVIAPSAASGAGDGQLPQLEEWIRAVETREAVIKQQDLVITNQDEMLKKKDEVIASFKITSESYLRAYTEEHAANQDLHVALVQKDLVIKAMQSAKRGAEIRAFLVGMAVGGGGVLALRH